jgi:lipid A 4'-phosphatase
MLARLAVDMREHPSRWAIALLCVLFLFWQHDIALSRVYYIPGTGFTWSTGGLLEFVRSAVPNIIIGSYIACVLLWLAGVVKRDWALRITPPRILYLTLTLLVGPGLIVEALLKPNWGRARPKDIAAFGGTAAYTPPWQPASECGHNCSFVSGHAAVAFWVTAYAAFLPPRWRAAGLFAGVLFGLAVGMVRVMQGAHFFSDVIGAGLIVVFVNAVLARFILQPKPAP